MPSKPHSPTIGVRRLDAALDRGAATFFGHALQQRRVSFSTANRPQSGFTLVEMLVVITIIGILVALLIPTIAGVMRRARNASIAMEVQELSRAIEAYKSKVGDYPPDFTNRLAVTNHISKAYSRNTRNIPAWLNTNLNTSPIPANTPSMLDPAEAIVFWLSQIRKNVRDPLGGTGDSEVYFQFEQTRLKDADGDSWPEYYPKFGPDAPYVYFDGRQISVPDPNQPPVPPRTLPTFAYAWAIYPSPYSNTTANQAPNIPQRLPASIPTLTSIPAIGVVRPYRSNLAVSNTEIQTWQNLPNATYPNATRTQWMAPGKFQIISAGLDSHFGVPEPTTFFKSYPTMNYYSDPSLDRTNDESNIANFSEMKTLEDAVP